MLFFMCYCSYVFISVSISSTTCTSISVSPTLPHYSLFQGNEVKPTTCVNCGATNSYSMNSSKTEYGNYQKMTLQETPGSVPAGRVPRYKGTFSVK